MKAGARALPLPADLEAALAAHPVAGQRFNALPPSHQREYLKWIEEAKKPDTRARRIQGTVEPLTG
ncbi:MAG: YdeI/OmpD-associated family protein [Lautropia sp.]|nr:YdeI/OmpD-associated family protein [Lautropia sp.]